ncbi:hypothetical protein D3870_03935 [Noviherbaspirillum cavernae]|uniref:Pilus assembly protein PilO n=1 Tax=Noviherbaspirillum cavernae TaxID=2320862 RepID=A0A418WYG0_9BURK|nr:hypothetical protein [Noviherbaspirillum cavernae]RJG05280.1 hypothetical protein D3870_03935 [Noviherbaspirillum cavernae]
MKSFRLGSRILQMRLALARVGWIQGIACLLCLIGVSAWLLGLPQLRVRIDAQHLALVRTQQLLQATRQTLVVAPRPVGEARLAAFYDSLGEAKYVEQQIKTLFAIAGKTGLMLRTAEYRLGESKDGHFQTYQVVFPVKGSYSALRQFCEQLLLAIPFASLDELTFKREAIGNPALEARVRLTLYLTDAPLSKDKEALMTRDAEL